MSYVVAIDSGGTHTAVRVRERDGVVKALPEIAVSLGTSHSDREIEAAYQAMFEAVRGETHGQPTSIWISAAGYSQATRARFDGLLERASAGLDLSVGICNDADALVLAHDPRTVVLISGTGSVAKARDVDGTVISVGDDDWVVADYGSGFWIGLEGIRTAYRSPTDGPRPALLAGVLGTYGPTLAAAASDERTKLREIARGLANLGTGTKAAIASFARAVTDEAERGDPVSQKIVRDAAQDLAESANQVYRKVLARASLVPKELPPAVILSGSVAFRSPYFAEAFRSSLDLLWFDVRRETERTIELTIQPDGLQEVVDLAQKLASGGEIPLLDEAHPRSIFKPH